jgi:prepilin-type N-terminal cleavage/methylation domain-containing protein
LKNKSKKPIRNSQSLILNSRKGFTRQSFLNEKIGGFTLIEMLIVVAIIGILASAIMVGLGPAQQKGRDARRMSDLNQTQNALELYYTKYGTYPGVSGAGGASSCSTANNNWSNLANCLTDSQTAIGVSSIPNDPNSANSYCYLSDGTDYILGANLEILPSPTSPNNCANVTAGTLSGKSCTGASYCIGF